MADDTLIKVKCLHCDKEFGVSVNAFDHADKVKIECWDGCVLYISLDKETKILTIAQAP